MYFVNLWTLKSHHSEALLIWNLVFPNKNVDPSIETHTHTHTLLSSFYSGFCEQHVLSSSRAWMNDCVLRPTQKHKSCCSSGRKTKLETQDEGREGCSIEKQNNLPDFFACVFWFLQFRYVTFFYMGASNLFSRWANTCLVQVYILMYWIIRICA